VIRWPVSGGPWLRRTIGIMLVAEALGYGHIVLAHRPLTTSYLIQAAYAPLWLLGLALALVGISLIATVRKRYTLSARMIAAAGIALLSTIAVTFYMADAWTAVYRYATMAILLAWEMIAIEWTP